MPALDRTRHVRGVLRLLDESPVVAILGARQVGKTTLARDVAAARGGEVHSFDLEDRDDVRALAEPRAALGGLRGLVVLDEIHRVPDLFPALRVLADRPDVPARFLVLGSASPELLRQSSETLAGRIAFHDLGPFALDETGAAAAETLWLRGGFPRSFLAADDAASARWRRDFTRTYLERDVPQLGVAIPPVALGRLWAMLAHGHGAVLNLSDLGRSLGVAHTTVRRWIGVLCGTFVVRQLLPWHENLSKRQVKSPKVWLADSGLLHSLLDVTNRDALIRHPKCGASWEGFALEQVIRRLGVRRDQCWFWATHASAELDLLVTADGRRLGFDVKRTTAPEVTTSMRIAQTDLRLDRLVVVHAGERSFPMARGIDAVALPRLLTDLEPVA